MGKKVNIICYRDRTGRTYQSPDEKNPIGGTQKSSNGRAQEVDRALGPINGGPNRVRMRDR
ncbi:hypothetical protein GCM10027347_51120 [Larkinella harenae]